jgi:hypothetical protein
VITLVEALHDLQYTCRSFDFEPPKFIVFGDDASYGKFADQLRSEMKASVPSGVYSTGMKIYGIHFPHPSTVKLLGGVQ